MHSTRIRLALVLMMVGSLAATGVSAKDRQVRATVLEPVASETVRRIYADGEPVAVAVSDSAPVLLKLGDTALGMRHFVRVWAFVTNHSDRTIELVPQEQISVQVIGSDPAHNRALEAQTPSTMLRRIDTEQHAHETAVVFSSILSELATALGSPDAESATSGRGPERARIEASGDLRSLELLYAGMKHSVNAGLLKRNTLPPGASANGDVFFDYGFTERGTSLTSTEPAFAPPMSQKYRVTIRLAGAPERTVDFVPARGE